MDNNNNADRPDEKKQEDEEQDKKNSSDSASHSKLDPKDITPTSTATAPPLSREGNSGSFDMQNQSQSQSQSQSDPLKVKSPSAPSKSVTWSSELTSEAPSVSQASSMNVSSSPYVSAPSPAQSSSSSVKNTMHTVRDVLGRWGKKAGDTTKKGQDLAGNLWQHLKTGPSFTDATMGRIAQGTKVIVEGGYEKIFQHTFDTIPEEQLQRSYVCYLSTSAGPVMGILYLSTAKLAFCSDNPLSYQVGDRTEWSYYKVVIPLHQLKAVNSSKSKTSSAEKYIQVVSVDNHEFWFMGFVNYDSAVKCLQESLQARDLQAG